MDVERIVKLAEQHVKNGSLTYTAFDKIFDMLSRKEQYQVCEILYNNGIQLVDEEKNDVTSSQLEDSLVTPDDLELLDDKIEESAFDDDDSVFKDPASYEDYLFFPKEVKQSNNILVHLVQEGNRQAKQDLCIKNENLIHKYANIYYRYLGNDLEYEDLLQVGFIGLLTAAEKFDFTKETAFSTYAVHWIKQAISRELLDRGFRIRIPVHVMEKIIKMNQLDAKYDLQQLDFRARIKRIAEDMATTPDKIEDLFVIKNQFLSATSLDTPVGEEEETSLGDYVPNDDDFGVEEIYFQRALSAALDEVLATLSPREEKIIRLRYGLDDGRVKTLEEVGKEFDITRERIRQIEAKAFRKLKHPSRSKKIKDYLNN